MSPPFPPLLSRSSLRLFTDLRSHSDYDLFTILAQDQVGGLQVLNREKQWVDATPVPGTFVVNIADRTLSRGLCGTVRLFTFRCRAPEMVQ